MIANLFCALPSTSPVGFSRMGPLRRLSSLRGALLGSLLLAACGGPQVATTETERPSERPTETGPVGPPPPTAEELEAQRQDRARATFAEAVSLYEAGTRGARDYARIERLLGDVLEVFPDLAEVHFNIAVLREEQGDRSGAVAAYQRAGEVDPTFARGMANLAYLMLMEGDVSGATAVLQECIARKETESGCNVNLALLYVDGHVPPPAGGGSAADAAIERLRFALGGEARNASAYANIARIYSEEGRLELARLMCENAILQGIDEPELHNRLGLIALEQDDVLTAYQEFRRAAELDPGHRDANENVGAMALAFRDYVTALAALEVVLDQEPDNADVRLSYGAALRGLERFDEAEAQYTRVLESSPGHPGALYNLAVLAQEGRADYAAACRWYRDYLASPSSSGHEKVDDVTRRFTNLRELVMNLADFGQIDAETAAACAE